MQTGTAHDDTESAQGRTLSTVISIVGFAFIIRLLFVFLNYKSLAASDHFEHFGAEMGWTARSLALGQGFSSPFYPHTGPTALVCPLYPLVLAGIFRVFGVYTNASALAALSLNSIFSALTGAVIFLGMRRRFGFGTARAAAWIWALYPYAIYYSAVYLWDCALTSLLFACCFFAAVTRLPHLSTRAWAGYGFLAGMTALSNPSILTLLPALLGYAAWKRWQLGKQVSKPLLLTAGMLVLTLAPWTIRNVRVMHQPVLMRDGFWAEFYAGNAGDTSHSNPGWTHPASNPLEMRRYRQLGETRYMAQKHLLSVQRVERYPGSFAVASARRFVRFWTGYWSFSRAYLEDEALDLPNVPFCTALTLLMLVGTWQLLRWHRWSAIPYVLTFLIFPLPYYVTHASMDYRQPIEPIVVAAVAYGAARLLRSRRRSTGIEMLKLQESLVISR